MSASTELSNVNPLNGGRIRALSPDDSAGPSGYVPASSTADFTDYAASRQECKRKTPIPVTPQDRHQLSEYLGTAFEEAKSLEQAVASNDPQQAAIAGIDLRNALRGLWRLRRLRSDDWATIVNKLQVAISGVEFELFTREMAVAVRMTIESHLAPDVDNEDVQAVTVLLERNDLHPWKSLADHEG